VLGVTVGVLALQGDVREHHGALADCGAESCDVRTPADLSGLSGLILPGGESTTLSLLLQTSGLFGPVADALRDGLPVFGTCAGMILLAATVLDGRRDQRSFAAIDCTVQRNGYGRQASSFECDLAVEVLGPTPLPAVFIRAPKVSATGPDVQVLATLVDPDSGVAHPVVCREGDVLVTAFHPELTADRRLHRLFVGMVQASRRSMR
jgi:pyridoxal 5'-phosphate synthase pdxT subunit